MIPVAVSGLLGLGYFISELLLVNYKPLTKKRVSGGESQSAAIPLRNIILAILRASLIGQQEAMRIARAVVVVPADVAASIDAPAESSGGPRNVDHRKRAAEQECMATTKVSEGSHDIATRVDAASLAPGCTWGIDRAEIALTQKKTVRDSGGVFVRSNNIALVVDSECLRLRRTRIIDDGEHSVSVEEKTMDVERVVVEAYHISGSIDRVRIGVGRAWEIYGGEAISTAEEAVLGYAIQIIVADNVAAGIDSPGGCVHRSGHIKGQKRSPCE